jgi:molecular chaperone DnaK
VYSVEKSLADYGDKITEAERADITSALEESKKVKDGEDTAAIKDAMAKLTKASHRLAEEVYKKSQAEQGGPAGQEGQEPGAGPESSDGSGGEKVVDAEFEEKK